VSVYELLQSIEKNDPAKIADSHLLELYDKVATQATRHTTRSKFEALYNISRPNEDKIFKDWRESNIRHITSAPINMFSSMVVRVLHHSFVDINNLVDETQKEYLNEVYLNRYNFDNFRYEYLIPLSFRDCNALVVEFPFNPSNPDVPLTATAEEGGLRQNESLATETKVVSSYNITHYSHDKLIWKAGQKDVSIDPEKVRYAPYYIGVDKEAYWIIIPRLEEGDIVYDIKDWYAHDKDILPVTEIAGRTTTHTVKADKTKNLLNRELLYKEAFTWQAYEYLDQAIIDFSSDQVNSIRFMSPLLALDAEIECPTCNGTGFVETNSYLSYGKEITCGDCKGTRKINNVGQFSTLKIRRSNSEFDKAGTPASYITPPTDTLKYGFERWQELIKMAERTLCVDPLESTGNESGVAKELRLEPKGDLMKDIGKSFINMTEGILNVKSTLRTDSEPVLVNIPLPLTYETKTVAILKMDVETAALATRRSKFLKQIEAEFRGDEMMIKSYKLAIDFAPLMIYNDEETTTALAQEAYNEKDIIRRDFALRAYEDILAEDKNSEKTFKEYRELAETWMVENGLFDHLEMAEEEEGEEAEKTIEEDALPEDLDELEEVMTALLNEEIDRSRAIELIVIIEDMTEEEAEELVVSTGL